MSPDDLIALNDEIAGMARAGLPLDQGLAALARDMARGELKRVTADIAEDLRSGRTLPEALERQGSRVPPYYANLLATGIRTGRLADVLTTLTCYTRALSDLRILVFESMLYPIVVLVFAGMLFGFLCCFVLPQFDDVFRNFNMKLPFLTELSMSFGRHPGWLVVLPLSLLVGGFLAAWFVLRRTAAGRRSWARFVYTIPLVGTLLRAARLAAFADLLGILIDHETPLPEAFRLAGQASSDPIMAATAAKIHTVLSQGHSLGEALRGQGLVPEWVAWLVSLGERRGTLGQSLHQIAENYRRQVDVRTALLRSALPSLLIITVAGTTSGFFVLTMMLPMVNLLEGLSK